MNDANLGNARSAAIRTTERLGFFQTAEAMREIAGISQAERVLDARDGFEDPASPFVRICFSEFRDRFDPFE